MQDKYNNRIISVQEAAYILRLSGSSVCNLIAAGMLSAKKKGREWQITTESIYNYIARFWPKTVIEPPNKS